VVSGVPLDLATTFRPGASLGPAAKECGPRRRLRDGEIMFMCMLYMVFVVDVGVSCLPAVLAFPCFVIGLLAFAPVRGRHLLSLPPQRK
jgi:hypothetical protein